MNTLSIEWSQQCSLHIYVRYRQALPKSSFWSRHLGPSLGQKLLQLAKQQGIHQAVLYHTKAGYLAKEQISHHFAESTPSSHPLCLELIDSYQVINSFITNNQAFLQEATLVLQNFQTFQRIGSNYEDDLS